ncbi:MAG: 1-acyl-sn-glycerol-3-phosphate acyltransferase [Actinobacteria bacterium]|nr:1-acyl-sn-glycerol-3-phosphate acyltransferase [Actinomycetota bacterium]
MRWVRLVVRSLATWAIGALATVAGATGAVAIAAVDDTSPLIDGVIRWWARTWLTVSGTELTVRGQEHIDPDRSYVVVANHLSTLDIMACLLAVPLPIRFLAKKELFRIPILAQGMRAVGIVEVDREGRSAVHTSVNRQADELIEKNRSLIIYAEGTRPRNGVMRPFKKGAFTMAITTALPVLPVSLHGSYEAARPGRPWFNGGRIEVIIDPPVPTANLTRSDATVLRDQVYEIISTRVREMGGRVGSDT